MNPWTIRWKMVPLYNPWRASFLKFSIVFGAASVQNWTTISPSLVLITATSFDAFIVGLSAFFSSAAKSVELKNSAAKIDIFIMICGTNEQVCHVGLSKMTKFE